MREAWMRRLLAIGFLSIAAFFLFRTESYLPPRQVDLATLPMLNLDGTRYNSATLRGRAVVLNFWAPWCAPCRFEMPWLERLQQKNPGLVVIGIEDDPDAYWSAQHMQGRADVTYPLVQPSPEVRRVFGHVLSLPTTLYISRSGAVKHTVTGLIPEPLMERFAQDALGAE